MPEQQASSHPCTTSPAQLSPPGPQLSQLAFLAMGYSKLSQDKAKV